MKNRVLRSMAILGLFFMLAGAGIQAQTPSSAQVKIPFDFSAGNAKMKSGTYTIKRVSDRSILLRSEVGKTAILSVPLTIDAGNTEATERLVFNRYGDKYFLSQIWLSVDSGRQVYTTGEEVRVAREFKRVHQSPSRIDIAARVR